MKKTGGRKSRDTLPLIAEKVVIILSKSRPPYVNNQYDKIMKCSLYAFSHWSNGLSSSPGRELSQQLKGVQSAANGSPVDCCRKESSQLLKGVYVASGSPASSCRKESSLLPKGIYAVNGSPLSLASSFRKESSQVLKGVQLGNGDTRHSLLLQPIRYSTMMFRM